MLYRLSVAKPLQEAVPAIAADQLEAAISRLKSADHDSKAFHSARKHFKRARALLGLAAPAARGKNAKASQKLIASAARMLSASRDARVAIGAAEGLEKDCSAGGNASAFTDLTAFLIARRDRTEEKLNSVGLEQVLGELEKAKASLKRIDLGGAHMGDLLRSACATYRLARRAMRKALTNPEDEPMHDWRKLTQQHWRHTLLLKESWPKEAKGRTALARQLSEILGQYNDLAVVRETVLTNSAAFRSPADVAVVCQCIEKKQRKLLRQAASSGERLYAEKPKAFARRVETYSKELITRMLAQKRGRDPEKAVAHVASPFPKDRDGARGA
ncbi:MAG: CHAD domain-containing protein [Rhodomicrobium sp.]